MKEQVRISHPDLLLFSRWTAPGSTEESSGRVLSWQSPELDTPTVVSCVGTFEGSHSFNCIRIGQSEAHPQHFPRTFRIEISPDGTVWEPILKESDFVPTGRDGGVWHFPLINARHVKFLFVVDRTGDSGSYFAAFGEFRVMISGIIDLGTSSELDRLWVKENLIDSRPDYGWSSMLRTRKQEESIRLDLGSINRVGEIRLLSKNDTETFFPEVFRVSYSEDDLSWHHLFEENGFLAEPGTWYRWRFLPTNIRFLKLTIDEGAKTREGKYVSQIIEVELFAAPDLIEKQEKVQAEPIPYASVLRSGIVRLAMDGEVREGVVIQGSDRRLRDATTQGKGIVELAADGEDAADVAVQGNDRRLKYSTEDLPGIVRLARDGEVRAGHAVQAHDRRLRYATEEEPGLVELAQDGENRPGVVVQGNDRRLRLSTTNLPGIVKLAENGSDRPNEAVQGNDHRLRDATAEQKGILRFARLGEDAADAAVQGNDPRLRIASSEAAGIVELALDGENRPGVVVQGSDARLRPATDESAGIVELARHGSVLAGRAVQASDPRLSDARAPLDHSHPYAAIDHDFSAHSGMISLSRETGKPFHAVADPPLHYAPVAGTNTGEGAGVSGRGREGVIGSGSAAGVVGYGTGTGPGVIGASRQGPGGSFTAEKSYALVAGGQDKDRGIGSQGPAILARGAVRFTDSLVFGESASSVAVFMPVDTGDVIGPGDVVVASKKPGHAAKSKEQGSTAVLGVVVEKSAVVLQAPEEFMPADPAVRPSPGKPKGFELIAVTGIVQVRVVADKHPVGPGDLLMASGQPGKAEKFTGQNFKPGMVFARSLGELKKGEGLIAALLVSG